MKDVRLITVKLNLVALSYPQKFHTDCAFISFRGRSPLLLDLRLEKPVSQQPTKLPLIQIRHCSLQPLCSLFNNISRRIPIILGPFFIALHLPTAVTLFILTCSRLLPIILPLFITVVFTLN